MSFPIQSDNIFGAAFSSPVAHTVLPVGILFQNTVRLLGYVPIPKTTFVGTETSVTLPGTDGVAPVISVIRPEFYQPQPGSPYLAEALEYMAILYDRSLEYVRPWLGFSGFIPGFKSGYYTRYLNTSTVHDQILGEGNLVGSLRNGMASTTAAVTPTVTLDGADATLRWNTSLNLASLPSGSQMFDFQWVPVFQSALPVDQQGNVQPLSLEITSQPSVRDFVAVIVQDNLSYVGKGLPMNHAVRIVKLATATVPIGNTYTFGFRITAVVDEQYVTKDVTLTLTISGG
jgi:hypothetical protein